MTQHVLFIVTNAAVIGPHNRKTGFFFAEVAHPFDVLDRRIDLPPFFNRDHAVLAHFDQSFGQDAAGELYALVTNTSANGTGGIV